MSTAAESRNCQNCLRPDHGSVACIAVPSPCIHIWLLGEGSRDVPGRCKKCGEERVFNGSRDLDDYWEFGFSAKARPPDPARKEASRQRGRDAVNARDAV